MVSKYYRFYKFIEIMESECDDEHLITMDVIKKRMKELTGSEIDRRVIYDYIKAMRELGFDVSEYDDINRGYYLNSAKLEEHEIKIMMDCISDCQFITVEKTNFILDKLEKLNSKYVANRIKEHIYIDKSLKTDNEFIFYNINNIYNAINSEKKIVFNYYHYDKNRKLNAVVDKESLELKRYDVSPIFIVLKEGKYYMVSINDKYKCLNHFRIDRMKQVNILDEKSSKINTLEEFKGSFDIGEYVKRSINMYTGKDCRVVIKFHKSILDKVLDTLGKDAVLLPYKNEDGTFSEEYVLARFLSKESEGLIRWIMQFGSKMKVLESAEVYEKVKVEAIKLLREYEGDL